jgi:predicted AlkP superfamily phosphohydrolase/phosphomutase
MSTIPEPRLRPVLVLALDGATFDVIEPLVARGRLPNLARWIAGGRSGLLRSTVPPVTFPAWTSFLTGREPGEHGIFDFTQKLPGEYRVRFVNATDRSGASIFARVSRAGGQVLALGMPATHPPEPVSGLLVTGFDAPVSAGTDEGSASDPDLYRRIAQRAGPWMRPGLSESDTGGDFHERAVGTLLERIEGKTRFCLEALRVLEEQSGRRPDLATIVFSESDTVGHHYWRDHDPASPRHDPRADPVRRRAVETVYERLDAACGEIRNAFGTDALCVVLSDHGMGGASRYVVHLNRRLSECGLLARKGRAGGSLSLLSRRARDTAVRLLPPALAQAVFRRARGAAARLESSVRFGGFDWARTRAFSEEANTQPGVWINLAGREGRGCVEEPDYEATRDRVIDALLDWKLPDGGPVVARARRREDVYAGPFRERAPDVVVELALDRGYGLSLVPTPWDETGGSVRRLHDDELAGGRGRGMNGTHRPDGVFVATAGHAAVATAGHATVATAGHAAGDGTIGSPPRALVDVAPWLLDRMGIPWEPTDSGSPHTAARAYTPEEDALVAERLRVLGYLE